MTEILPTIQWKHEQLPGRDAEQVQCGRKQKLPKSVFPIVQATLEETPRPFVEQVHIAG